MSRLELLSEVDRILSAQPGGSGSAEHRQTKPLDFEILDNAHGARLCLIEQTFARG
jgi:hypothetical protein